MLVGCVPAAYNASFDRAFLTNEFARAGRVDSAARHPAPARTWSGLGPARVGTRAPGTKSDRARSAEVATRLGIALENAHRASDDAEAALRVLLALGRDMRVPRTYSALVQEQRRLSLAQADERRLKWRGGA